MECNHWQLTFTITLTKYCQDFNGKRLERRSSVNIWKSKNLHKNFSKDAAFADDNFLNAVCLQLYCRLRATQSRANTTTIRHFNVSNTTLFQLESVVNYIKKRTCFMFHLQCCHFWCRNREIPAKFNRNVVYWKCYYRYFYLHRFCDNVTLKQHLFQAAN